MSPDTFQKPDFRVKIYGSDFHFNGIISFLQLFLNLGRHKIFFTHPDQPVYDRFFLFIEEIIVKNLSFSTVIQVCQSRFKSKKNGRIVSQITYYIDNICIFKLISIDLPDQFYQFLFGNLSKINAQAFQRSGLTDSEAFGLVLIEDFQIKRILIF
ncbi:DUF1374 domain-containing protein [Emticicia sp. CRIBPO]|uniref:DUF1374 domain-containing protein n=1 Tax=Emticicia sp. CRIBPO TaxID=2683258 RepID=UPI0038D3DA89